MQTKSKNHWSERGVVKANKKLTQPKIAPPPLTPGRCQTARSFSDVRPWHLWRTEDGGRGSLKLEGLTPPQDPAQRLKKLGWQEKRSWLTPHLPPGSGQPRGGGGGWTPSMVINWTAVNQQQIKKNHKRPSYKKKTGQKVSNFMN